MVLNLKTAADMQTCSFCRVAKPATREFFGSTPSGGLRQKCRECMNGYASRYGAANKDRARERNEKRRQQGGHIRLTDQERVMLNDRQGGLCLCCGEHIPDVRVAHVDHLLPVTQGGSHEARNLFLAHAQCNLEKHRKSLQEHWNWRLRVKLPTAKGESMLRLAEDLGAPYRSDRQRVIL